RLVPGGHQADRGGVADPSAVAPRRSAIQAGGDREPHTQALAGQHHGGGGDPNAVAAAAGNRLTGSARRRARLVRVTQRPPLEVPGGRNTRLFRGVLDGEIPELL